MFVKKYLYPLHDTVFVNIIVVTKIVDMFACKNQNHALIMHTIMQLKYFINCSPK